MYGGGWRHGRRALEESAALQSVVREREGEVAGLKGQVQRLQVRAGQGEAHGGRARQRQGRKHDLGCRDADVAGAVPQGLHHAHHQVRAACTSSRPPDSQAESSRGRWVHDTV